MDRREFLKAGAVAAVGVGVGARLEAETEAKPLELFGYGDVRLSPGKPQEQLEATQSILLGMDEDALLKPWRLRAGLPAPGPDMGGWYDEVPGPLRKDGHGFAPAETFGQWVSALARGYAATGDAATKTKMDRLLELYEPAISDKFYKNFRFPAYDYDKMVIGLIDAHEFAGSKSAFRLLDKTTDAAVQHLEPKAMDRDEVQRKWRAAVGDNTTDDYCWDEPYTLAENLYLAWQRGAGERYHVMAPKYLLNETYFYPLSDGKNVLPGHHAYSFCNALSSAMQAYLSDGSERHLRAAVNAHEMIVTTQSFATGGWGPDESFREPNSGALYDSLTKIKHSFETPCGSYAHFKLTRYLLRVTRDGQYGDSMERVFYNTVLGAKPLLADGHSFYYSDYSNTATKYYHDDRWPCCSGTLPQVAADYRISVYFRGAEGLWVNLYLPSTLKWTGPHGAHLELTQTGEYPLDGRVEFLLKASKGENFAMRLRIPKWAQGAEETQIKVNGFPVQVSVVKGFASISRKWKDGDRVELNLPMPMRLEAIEASHPETVALVRGPLVLFALTEDDPKVTREQLLGAQRMKGQAIWMAQSGNGPLVLTPFTEIHEERYRTYLRV
ncbi:glycoside hydrolase family 127 protein [Acidicapsa dinghuensis]|uniref:Glycoside hydrolase family 127 protein n=1 Tax=Acidicapsa dinghuensis TaxID=2218256 RepID=A0ABW1EFP7_9BACT|nr:glycoside hydrolase family 127 protein [Acidicapsa dinghuensis]